MNSMAMTSEPTPDPFPEVCAPPSITEVNNRKSWKELRQAVRETRKQQSTMINKVPHNFTFHTFKTDHGSQTRVYFLGVPTGSRENTLLYIDIIGDEQPFCDSYPWRLMLDSFQPFVGQYSKEEQLLRERKRLGSFGITSYDFNPVEQTFVFPASNGLFTCKDDLQTTPVFPSEVKTSASGTKLDPKLCPDNPNLLAFVSNNDIWVTNTATGHDKQLTFTHSGGDSRSAGVPSFVVQEEFDRYTGFWWQPKRELTEDGRYVYRILYEEVDESEVELLHIVSTDERCGVDDYRYPRAGTPNAKCTLKVLEFQIEERGEISGSVVSRQLVDPLTSQMPWVEYVVRLGWTREGTYVWAQVLDRAQQRLAIVLIPLGSFSQVGADEEMASFDASSTSILQVIYEETSDVWINVHDILWFFPQTEEGQISFIWASEKSGFRHLCHVTSLLLPQVPLLTDSAMDLIEQQEELLKPCIISDIAITKGEWEVSGKQIWVDEKRGLVYFIGLKDTPLETHLYVTSYLNPIQTQRLTDLGFSHTIALDKDCSLFVSVHSSINTVPAGNVCKIVHTDGGLIVPQNIGNLLEASSAGSNYHPPELFSYQSTQGHMVYGMLFSPHDVQVGKKYPTLLFVYGGPQVQLVTNAYKGLRFLRLHTLASLGYVVVVLDTQGSANRGLAFESRIQHSMGTVEIEEQVEGLHWIASQVDFLDLQRVAIHGWSYGGYLSLMGLAQKPEVFKLAIAGAPVVTWQFYDTGYTERYMNTPQKNLQAYSAGSVLEYVNRFPSEENRLLIVHGLIDENVHFIHTSALINALVKSCKPYQLQVYPYERHGIRNPEASEHYETMFLSFLQQHL